ncbi:uncharacterized protein C2845_PM02G16420 [Panicum miliaceum]|uniref:Bifunctional inhibitor/plant lipid transfer protein/seed storage helical domain-containing protein n=1 Tax=Panicum miliaceum TaxID=4540 RepID=A0A3L6S9R4_PANMI|nr:uncharacterized protein C2845_PM02G16420 [Panicum miliaceum]
MGAGATATGEVGRRKTGRARTKSAQRPQFGQETHPSNWVELNIHRSRKEGPKQKPSSDCCRTVQAADAHVSCVCDYLGSRDAKEKLSMEKVFYVSNLCGVTVPAGCGE